MAWIAIDAGTSVIKAVAFADDGREIAVARQKTEVLRPNAGFSEQSMHDVWAAVVKTVREVLPQLQEPVRGIVSTAQGDGAWLVDAEGQPVGNAILWNDGRAAAEVERFSASGAVEKSFRLSGSVTYPGLPNAIFAWLDEHEPQRIAKAKWSLTCNGWIFAKLTGRYAADLSDASNPFSDVKKRAYADENFSAYGVEKYQSLMPAIALNEDIVAPLQADAARELGVAQGTPCVMAPYDIIATAYGAGASRAGQACVILGTTICAEAITASLDLTGEPAGTTIALHDGLFLRAMPTLTGCEALDWAARLLEVDGLDALGALAATSSPGANGVFFLPYLSPAGERSPFLDPGARGSFHGVTLQTTRADMARAVYEGLSFVIRECLEAASAETLTEVRVCGGGARSDVWCQLIADVTGVAVSRTSDSEVGARGAHLFALAVTQHIESVAHGVEKHVQHAARFLPSQREQVLYRRLYETFLRVREFASSQWRVLEDAR